MKQLIEHLSHYWFAPAPPTRLALLRIATGIFTLGYLVVRLDLFKKVNKTEADLFTPTGLAGWLSEPLPDNTWMILIYLTLALNIAYLIGWRFRMTGPLFGMFILFLFSYRYSWSMIYHDTIALVLQVGIISFAASADAYSYDSWKHRGIEKTTKLHWRYNWPVRLMCATLVLTYFLSGIAKVSGDLAWEWMSGDAMRSQIAVDALRKEMLGGGVATPLFLTLYEQVWLFSLMGMGTILLEVGAPFVLLHRKLAMVWAFLTWTMHWGIFLLMGITFRFQMSGIAFLPFFDVEKYWHWLVRKSRISWRTNQPFSNEQSKGIVLFDGVCNFCDATILFILKRDTKEYFRFTSIQSELGKQLLKQYNIPFDLTTIVLLEDGKAYTLSTAALRIARKLNSPIRLLYCFILVPAPLRDLVYRFIANRRYHWFGKKEICEIPTAAVLDRFL